MTLQLIILLLSYSMNYTRHLFCFPLYKCSPVWTLPSAASFVFLRGWNETKQGLENLMSHIKTAQECFCRSIFANLSDSMANCKLISFYFFVLESTGLYRNRNHVRWRVQRSVTVILFETNSLVLHLCIIKP